MDLAGPGVRPLTAPLADLHLHSTASDGTLPPEAVVARGAALGLAAVALTDHDTLAGLPAATAEGERLGRLKSLALVKIAEHRPGGWLLRDVVRTNFQEKSVTQTKVKEERWASKLDAVALTAGTDKPRYLAGGELRKAIDYRLRNSLDASEFEVIYWGRWFYALNILALCLAAVPFAFGTLRSGGLGKRLFIGIVFSLGFWLLQQQCVRLAQVYHFDYRVAYLIPTLIMLAVSWFLFRRRSG